MDLRRPTAEQLAVKEPQHWRDAINLVHSEANRAPDERTRQHWKDVASLLEGDLLALKVIAVPSSLPSEDAEREAGPPKVRSCNRHQNCDEANQEWLVAHPAEKFVPFSFHCHDEDCEDCFGY